MKKCLMICLAAMLMMSSQNVSAEIKTFHEDNFYVMRKDEPIRQAQEKVFLQAVRTISESVNIYVKSRSQTELSKLTIDKIETLTAAVLRIKSKKFDKQIEPDGTLKITVSVNAEMNTDDINNILQELVEAKNADENYEAILTDYTKRKNLHDTVYSNYINSYHKRIMQKIRDGCKLQKDDKLDEAMKTYNEAINEMTAEGSELSLIYIKRGHIYNQQQKSKLATADFEKAVSLNNDEVGVHYAKAILLEQQNNKIEAAAQYRKFIEKADIIYYDMEIMDAVDRIIMIEGVE